MKRSKALIIFVALVVICSAATGVIVNNKKSFTRTPSVQLASEKTTDTTPKSGVIRAQDLPEPVVVENTTEAETTTEAITAEATTVSVNEQTTAVKGKTASKTVTWKAMSGANSYDVYRSTSKNGTYTCIGNSTTTKYVDNTVEAGKAYYYKVKPSNATSATVTSAQTTKVSSATVTRATATTTKAVAKTTSTTKYATPATCNAGSNTGRITGFEQQMLNQVNAARAKAGVPALTLSSDLTRLSSVRAEELSRKYNKSHTRPDGSAWHTIFNDLSDPALKSWDLVAENIAYGQKDCNAIMSAWLNSKGHYDNIVNKNFTHVGFGCYSKNGTLYWEQLFLEQ